MEKVLKAFAWIISVIFHPIGIAVIGCTVINFALFVGIVGVEKTITSLVFLRTIKPIIELYYLLPLLFCGIYAMFFMRKGNLDNNRHRLMLLSFILLTYVVSLFNTSISAFYVPFLMGCTFVVFVATAITFFWRISLHTIGMGGLLGFFTEMMVTQTFNQSMMIPVFMITVIIAGLVGSARLYLGAHTPAQIYAGYAVGFVGTAGGMFVNTLLV